MPYLLKLGNLRWSTMIGEHSRLCKYSNIWWALRAASQKRDRQVSRKRRPYSEKHNGKETREVCEGAVKLGGAGAVTSGLLMRYLKAMGSHRRLGFFTANGFDVRMVFLLCHLLFKLKLAPSFSSKCVISAIYMRKSVITHSIRANYYLLCVKYKYLFTQFL